MNHKTHDNDEEKLMTSKELALILNLTSGKIVKDSHAGIIPAIPISKTGSKTFFRFSKRAIDAWLEKISTPGSGPIEAKDYIKAVNPPTKTISAPIIEKGEVKICGNCIHRKRQVAREYMLEWCEMDSAATGSNSSCRSWGKE